MLFTCIYAINRAALDDAHVASHVHEHRHAPELDTVLRHALHIYHLYIQHVGDAAQSTYDAVQSANQKYLNTICRERNLAPAPVLPPYDTVMHLAEELGGVGFSCEDV